MELPPTLLLLSCSALCGTSAVANAAAAAAAALCLDMELLCPLWASLGECAANPKYMVGTARKLGHCRASCGKCAQGEGGALQLLIMHMTPGARTSITPKELAALLTYH
jgi:hypothetical protein